MKTKASSGSNALEQSDYFLIQQFERREEEDPERSESASLPVTRRSNNLEERERIGSVGSVSSGRAASS